MFTRCPECQTIHAIDEDALQASLGIVHCLHCSTRFDAQHMRCDAPPAQQPTADPAAVPTAEPGATPRNDSEDWFAEIESELASQPPTQIPEAAPTHTADDVTGWSADQPHATEAAIPPPMDSPAIAEAGATGTESVATQHNAVDDAWLDDPLQLPKSAPELPTDDTTSAAESRPDPAEASPIVTPLLLKQDTDDAEPVPPSDMAVSEDDVGETAVTADASLPADQPDATTDPATAESVTSDSAQPDDESATGPAHVYVRPRQRRVSRAVVGWIAGCCMLALLLAAQLAWINRTELFRNPSTRPWVARVCRIIPCRLPPIRDVAKLELLSRDVRPDPNVAGALSITATVRNNAPFRQPWPVVVVELTNLDNQPVAMRRFRPAEYLPDPARRAAGIAPGATAALAFHVADPGRNAVAFQFSFE